MQSRKLSAAIAALAVIVAVALFIVLRDGDGESPAAEQTNREQPANQPAPDQGGTGGNGGGSEPEPDPKPEVPVIEVQAGQPVGGVQELEFAKGEVIRFVVESDADDEVHVHGYDLEQGVAAGKQTTFEIPATIEGVFEVELHHSVAPIAEITVNPA